MTYHTCLLSERRNSFHVNTYVAQIYSIQKNSLFHRKHEQYFMLLFIFVSNDFHTNISIKSFRIVSHQQHQDIPNALTAMVKSSLLQAANLERVSLKIGLNVQSTHRTPVN